MYEISIPQEFHRTSQLFEKMPDNDLVQSSSWWHWIFPNHVNKSGIVSQFISLLDKVR
jgi:hypothetical protein